MQTPRPRVLIVTVLAWLMVAASAAAAAPPQITHDGCLADTASQGCVDLPQLPLKSANGVAVSPDGRSVYVAAAAGNAVAHLFRDTARGRLAWDGCLSNDGSQNCGDLLGAPLGGAGAVAVSPDGRSVYVTSFRSGSIAHFFRSTTGGQIYYDGCLNNDGSQNCADLPKAPLEGPTAVAVSPDGRSVYVTSLGSGSIAQFDRNGPDGQITYAGCLANDDSQGCVDLPGAPLDGANALAVSRDGRTVYVASYVADSIGWLFRNASTGKLSWDGCLNNDGSQGCGNVPGSPLDSADAVAVSPDGRSVYVSSSASDSISHLFRNRAAGQLTWDGCVSNDGTEGCVDLPGAPIDRVMSVAAGPDGRSVYAVSHDGDSIARLFRGPAGRLAWDGCLNNDGTEGCRDLPGEPLDGPAAVAASPDGRSVYVASIFSASIAHFVPAPPAPPPPTRADTLAPAISGLTLTHRRFRAGRPPAGTTFRYTLSEPARVTVAIQRLRRGRRARAGAALTRTGRVGRNRVRFSGRIGRRKLPPGAYRARFSATDAAGNRSATATRRFRIVRG